MKKGKLVWATGISGCGRKDHYNNFLRLSRKNNKSVLIYNAGQMLFEQAKKLGIYLSQRNVLNADPELLNALRGNVFEKILGRLDGDLKIHDAVVISVHSYFFWEECFHRAYNSTYINEFNPDFFVIFIDHDEQILKRLANRAQWINQRLTPQKILYWQNFEVESTISLAEERCKEFFAIPVRQPSQTLYCLLFEPWREPIYFNAPMTHLFGNESELNKVKRFVERLWKYPFVVFNPFLIETGIVDTDIGEGEITRHRQTIHRDLRWFVRQCKRSVAFFPVVISSPGVFDEVFTSFRTTKDPWIICPAPFSPFLVGRTTHPPFPNERNFFRFLENEYLPQRKKTVKEQYGVDL